MCWQCRSACWRLSLSPRRPRLLRRVQQAGPAGKGQVIELIGSRALGPRDRLMLVQVGNEQILLGLSPGTITALHVLKEPVHCLLYTSPSPRD